MKKNNKVSKKRSGGSGKTGLLVALMLLSATTGWAKEQWARVMGQYDEYYEDATRFTLDLNDDGIADIYIKIPGTKYTMTGQMLKDLLAKGASITFEDEELIASGGMPYVGRGALLSIEGIDILDIFPDTELWFYQADRKRAEAARQRQQRGGR